MFLLTCAFVLGFFCQTMSQRIWPLNPAKGTAFNYQPRRPVADKASEPSHLNPVFLQAPSQNEFRKAQVYIDEGQRPKLQMKIHLPKDFPNFNSFRSISDSNRNQVPPVIYGFIPILSDDNEEDGRISISSEIDRNRPNTFREFSQHFDAQQRTEQGHHSRDNVKESVFKQHELLHPPSPNLYAASNVPPNAHLNNRFASNSHPNHFPIERLNGHQQQDQENIQHNSGPTYRENRTNGNADSRQKKPKNSRQENPRNNYEEILENESNGFAHSDFHNVQIPNKIPHTAEPVVIPVNDISPLNLEVTDHSILNLKDSDKDSVFIPTIPIPNSPENQDKKLFLVFKAPTMVTTERPASAPFSVKQRNNVDTDKIDEKVILSLGNDNKFDNCADKISDYHINENRDHLNSQFNREAFSINTQQQNLNNDPKYGILTDNSETFHRSSPKDAEHPFHHELENNHDNKPSFHLSSQTNVQETHHLDSSQNREALAINTQLSYQQDNGNHHLLNGDNGPFHHLSLKDAELPNHQTAESNRDNRRSLDSSLAISQITYFLGGSMPKVSIRGKNIFLPTQKYLNKNIVPYQPLLTGRSNIQQTAVSNEDDKPSFTSFQTDMQKTQQSHSQTNREAIPTDKQLSYQQIDENHQALNENREFSQHSSPKERKASIHQTVENNYDNRPFLNRSSQKTQHLQPLLNKETIPTNTLLSYQQSDPNHRAVNDNRNAFHHSSPKDTEASIQQTKTNPNNEHSSFHIDIQTAPLVGGPTEKVSKHKENTFPPKQKYSNNSTNSQLPHHLLPKENQDSISNDRDVKGDYQPSFAGANRTLHLNPASTQGISSFQGNSLLFPSASPSIAQISYAQSSLQKKVPTNNLTNPVIYFSFSVPNSKTRQKEIKLKNTQPKTLKEPKLPGKSEASLQHRPTEGRVSIPGRPGLEYPNYNTIPYTNFECGSMKGPGFYADLETGCQVFHNCDVGMSKHSFMCPNGTIFHQELVICDWWYNVRCEDSPRFYDLFPQGVDNSSIL